MLKQTKIHALLTAALYAVAGTVAADELSGVLGQGSTNVDHYRIECFDNGNGATDHMSMRVRDGRNVSSGSILSVQTVKGRLAYNATDNGPEGDTRYSPTIEIRGGDGVYLVLVNKSRGAADDYDLEYHCTGRSGRHTGVRTLVVQDR